MQLVETKKQYGAEEAIYAFQDTLGDTIKMNVYVECSSQKFLQFQKDILEDFVAEFTSKVQTLEEDNLTELKQYFENSLKDLNIKFDQFASKVRDVERFELKGVIQLIVDNLLLSSMIWEVSLLIMRDQRILYTLENSVDPSEKIDAFSDLVEWNLEGNDQLVYVGVKISDILGQQDRKELEAILLEDEAEEKFLLSLESILVSRVEKQYVSFLLSYIVNFSLEIKKTRSSSDFTLTKGFNIIGEKIQASWFLKDIKKKIWGNKIYLISVCSGVLILLLISSLLSQRRGNEDPETKFKTSSWVYIDLTIEDIQKEMAEFQNLDPSSPEKSLTYSEIMQKLDFIESKGKWLQDVKQLKTILQAEYYKGFNIIPIEKLTQFTNGSRILAFNSSELEKLGTLHSVFIPKNIAIAGSKAVLLDITSDSNRGTLTEFNGGNNLSTCTVSLLRDGLYCATDKGEISLFTKSWVTPLETTDGAFSSNLGWLGIFNKNNFYVFQKNISSVGNIFVTRYRNVAGSESNFQGGSSYDVLLGSGMNFTEFWSFAIDGSFFGWSNKKPYLFWRSNLAGTSLSYREIPLKGGDIVAQEFTDKVKIITSSATKYIYLFDQEKQLFVAYETVNPKTNDDNKAVYNMKYLFSFKFMIEGHPVIDMNVSEASWDKPELYILNDEGVYKVALYEFIDSIRNNDTLKTVPAAQ